MMKKYFLKIVVLFLSFSCEQAINEPPVHQGPPNIILIVASNFEPEVLDGEKYQIPNLEKMAAEGVVFSSCFAPLTTKGAHYQILKGSYLAPSSITDSAELSLAQLLKEAGYATSAIGQWPFATDDLNAPYRAGFEEYLLGGFGQQEINTPYWEPALYDDGLQLKEINGLFGPDIFFDNFQKFINRKAGSPFFVYLPIALAAEPLVHTPASKNLSESMTSEERYSDMVAYTDLLVGKILKKIKRAGLSKHTLVVFVVDSDPAWYADPEVVVPDPVPLLAWWPGTLPAGEKIPQIVGFIDFLPTLATVAKANTKDLKAGDGKVFLPVLPGYDSAGRDDVASYHPGKGWYVHNQHWALYGQGVFLNLSTKKQMLASELSANESETTEKLNLRMSQLAKQHAGTEILP